MLLFLQKIQWVNYVPYLQFVKITNVIFKKYPLIVIHYNRYQPRFYARLEHTLQT